MRLIFKEVGQGDSIIIEWAVEGNKKVAIIDSNLKSKTDNPSLKHIRESGINEIEFILMTHPHFDHYSGLAQILNYCAEENIKINYFFHTCAIIPEYLTASVKGNVQLSELNSIFSQVDLMETFGTIQQVGVVGDFSRQLSLEAEWKLQFKAPSNRQNSYYKNHKYKSDLEVKINSSLGNWLSTVIEIHNQSDRILLTSDAVEHVFTMLLKNGIDSKTGNLIVGQIPHHGSKDNYHKDFWRLNKSGDKPVATISTGENSYGHPSEYVVSNLEKFGYQVDLTNRNRITPNVHHASDLNIISSIVSSTKTSYLSKDLIYEI